MAFAHGKNAALTVNAGALKAFLENIDFSTNLDIADTTVFGATWKTGLAGIPSGSLSFSGYYDSTASTGPGAILFPLVAAGTAVTILFYPSGTAAGNLYTMTTGGIVTSYNESSPVGGAVTFSGTIEIIVLPVRSVI